MRRVSAARSVLVWIALVAWPTLAAAQTVTFDDRPSLRVGRMFRVDFTAKLQGDVRESSSPDDSGDAVDFTRRRIGVKGSWGTRIHFEVDREIDSKRPWRDAYVDVRLAGSLQVRAGQFKMPFSLEAMTSVSDLDVIYRGRAADALAPGRSVGASVHGRVAHRLVGYEVGVFARDGEVARFGSNPGAGRTAAARVTARTHTRKRSWSRVEVGSGATIGDVPEGRYSLRGRMTSGDVLFSQVYVNGRRTRVGVDVDWRPGPFDVRAEWLRVLDERKGQGLLGDTLPALPADGWHITGVWRMEQTFGRSRALWNWRSAELTTRVERLTFGSVSDAPAERHPRAVHLMAVGERAWTFGVNWSPTRWTRLQVNAIRERPDAAAMTVTGASSTVWTRVVRFQFAL